MLKQLLVGSLVALATSMNVALAQSSQTPPNTNTLSNPTQVIPNFDLSNLGPILSEMGVVWQRTETSDGRSYIAANVSGNLSIAFLPSACLDSGTRNCIGLVTYVEFNDIAVNPQTISAFNQKYWFISAGAIANNSSAFISRYDIADYGIPRGNVKSSLQNFVVLALKLQDELQSGSKTVSLDGYADDLASNYLNNQGFEEIGGTFPRRTVLEHHLSGFEAAPEYVKVFANDPNAPKNKISNITK